MTASWAYLGGKYKEVSITWGDKTVVVSTTAPKTMMPQVEYAMNNLVNAMNAVEGTPLEKLYKEKFILNIDNREYSSCIHQDLFNANMVGALAHESAFPNQAAKYIITNGFHSQQLVCFGEEEMHYTCVSSFVNSIHKKS